MGKIDFQEHAPIDFQEDASAASKDTSLPEGLHQSGGVDSAIRGALSTVTANHVPQIAGAIEHPIGALKSLRGVTGADTSADPDVANYIKTRDQYKNLYSGAKENHPYAYLGGELGGIALPNPTNLIKAASIPGRIAQAVGVGALYGEGGSEGDLARGQVGQETWDAAKGGVIGGTFQGGAEAIGALAPSRLKETAEDWAIKHLRPTAAVSRELGDEGLRSAAREALDSGAIQFGAKADTTAENLNNLVNEVGAAKGDIVNSSTASINPNDIAAKVQSEVINPLRQTAEGQPLADGIQGKSEAFLKQYPGETMTPAQLEAEKMAVQGNINYKANSNAANDAAAGYARTLKEGVEGAIADPNFQRTKSAYQNLLRAGSMSERTAALADGGNGLLGHITDTGLSSAALAHLNPATAGAVAVRGLTKGRITSSAATTLDGLANMLQATPQVFGRFAKPLLNAVSKGGDSLAVTNFLLGQQYPEYRAITSQDDKK